MSGQAILVSSRELASSLIYSSALWQVGVFAHQFEHGDVSLYALGSVSSGGMVGIGGCMRIVY